MKKKSLLIIILFVGLLIVLFFLFKKQHEFKDISTINTVKTEVEKTNSSLDFDPFQNIPDEPPGAIRYELNTDSSLVNWSISRHRGYVKFKEGYFTLLNDKIKNGVFYVAMDSIVNLDIDYQLMKTVLEKVLKSPEFFNSQKYPTSAFMIDSLRKISKDVYLITGYMKIFDIVYKINFKAQIKIGKNKITANSEKFYIDRTKWGLTAYSKNFVQQDTSFVVPDSIGLVIKILAEKR